MEKGLLSSNISLSKENLGCLGMPGREKECNLEAVVVRGLVWSCAVRESSAGEEVEFIFSVMLNSDSTGEGEGLGRVRNGII